MSYQVLARKWRPRDFSMLVGQSHAAQVLTNALQQQRLHHAYLFTGTRGVGKTTIARILAKCFNCETGITATPCLTCNTCIAIEQGHAPDLIEVDAASRTKVEDTRDLLSNVMYAPLVARFKIYLIDEVHMLSGHSFNALLKTLEEPPAHVKFIFATTEPKKLPITVLSRCLQLNLKKITVDDITTQLSHILTEEKMPFETTALHAISRAATGSMRDALSILEQAIGFGGGQIRQTDVAQLLGTLANAPLLALLRDLATGDSAHLLQELEHIAEFTPDYEQILSDLLALLHAIGLLQTAPQLVHEKLAYFNTDEQQELQQLSLQLSQETVQLYYQIGLYGRRDLGFTPDPRVGFEMTLLRMLTFKPTLTEDLTALVRPAVIPMADSKSVAAPLTPATVAPSTEKLSTPIVTTAAVAQPKKAATSTSAAAPPAPATAAPLPLSREHWPQLTKSLAISGMTASLAAHCALDQVEESRVTLTLDPQHAALLSSNQLNILNKALNDYLGRNIKLEITVAPLKNRPPIAIAQQQQEEQLAQTEQALRQNPHVQELLNTFNATIREDSIKIAEMKNEE